MNIYTKDGWLDIEHIKQVADRNSINFIIIIGKRQVGKTYGVLKFMLDNDIRFIFTRRVKEELKMVSKGVNSPFEKIKEYKDRIVFEKSSEYTSEIYRLDQDGEEEKRTLIGLGTALTTIGNIRGFNGDIYTDWVFDEFIPEEQLFKVRNECDTFLNAHTTINGNRELEGRPCLRTWLLANSNNLRSGVLDALKITREVERMSLKGEESRIIKDRGIMIILPESRAIIDKRKQGGLYKAIGSESKFSRMAYENEFAYNDFSDVGSRPIKEYTALIQYGNIIIHLHKNDKTLYVTHGYAVRPKYKYEDCESGYNKIRRDFPELKAVFEKGRMSFQDMAVKNIFLTLIK